MNKKKQLGQYFTPRFVADFMLQLASSSKNGAVLEPSSGEGVFLESLSDAGFTNIDAYDVDDSLAMRRRDLVTIQSFITLDTPKKYDLVIGNPPYVRWKNMSEAQKSELAVNELWRQYFNSLGDYLYIFILKSVELLKPGGELIFITPAYWLGTMHSQALRDYLVKHGNVDEIYHFSETPIFEKVTSSIIIFKFTKGSVKKESRIHRYIGKGKLTADDLAHENAADRWDVFSVSKFKTGESWILAPDAIKSELVVYESKCTVRYSDSHSESSPETDTTYTKLGDIATIANGLVSGLDKAFQLTEENTQALNDAEKKATLRVIKAKDMQTLTSNGGRKYIFLNDTAMTESQLKANYPLFYAQLSSHKEKLQRRYTYTDDTNYWDWVFLRSMKLFKTEQEKIFVPCKERITNKDRLRFCVAPSDAYPTQDVTAIYLQPFVKESIQYINALLNSRLTYDWVKYKGLIKGGIAEFSERPLASLPVRLINWGRESEVVIHDEITRLVREYDGNEKTLDKIDQLIEQLLAL